MELFWPKWKRQLFSDLKRHEGCILRPYQDTTGTWTIGYGHTGPDVTRATDPITQQKADQLLVLDMDEAIDDAKAVFKNFNYIDPVRKAVLVNMAFNLGRTKLSGFYRTIDAVEAGDWDTAALGMLGSKWARQVKGRAVELALRMRSGKIDPKHKV